MPNCYMSVVKILGILFLVSAPISGFLLQSRWSLLATQRTAQIVSHSTTTKSDGTVVHVTEAVGYLAKIRWWLVLLLLAIFSVGIICLLVAREQTRI